MPSKLAAYFLSSSQDQKLSRDHDTIIRGHPFSYYITCPLKDDN